VVQVPHAVTHQDGGSDEINVQGLSGVLRDLQRGKFSFVGNWDDFPDPGEPDRLAFAVDRLTIYRDTGTEWQKVATAHWDYIEGQPSEYFPAPHATTHEEGGEDALTPANIGANWNKLVNKPSVFPPSGHAASHQSGGADEINVEGLSGVLADPQTPKAHASTHKSGGSDPLDHGLLPGLRDDDHPQYLLADGSRPLSANWDIGDGRKILADWVRARDAAGLKLTDDAGNGLFVEDGGYIGIGTLNPQTPLHLSSDGDVYARMETLGTDKGVGLQFFDNGVQEGFIGHPFNADGLRITGNDIISFRIGSTEVIKINSGGADIYKSIDMNGNDIVNPGLVDGVDMSSHAARHQNGGADEINVNGLSGQLADYQKTTWSLVYNKPSTFPPSAHGSSHEVEGSDEVRAAKWVGLKVWGPGLTPPSSWSLLDLSSYVGARRVLCLLKVFHKGTSYRKYYFKPSDETGDIYTGDSAGGVMHCECSGSSIDAIGYVWVATGPDGKVYWKTLSTSTDDFIRLLAYIPCS